MATETSTGREVGIRDQRVVRARSQVAGALVVAETGRPAEAERKLRDALGVLERRHRYAAAARAAATLGYLLRERGDVSRAESTFQRARVLFDVASPVAATPRSRPPELDEERAEQEDYVQAKALLTTTTRGTAGETAISPAPRKNGDRSQSAGASDAIVSAASRLTRALGGGSECLRDLCSCLRSLIKADAVALCQVGQGACTLASKGNIPRRMMERLLLLAPPTGQMATVHDGRHSGMSMTVYAERKAITYLLVHRERDLSCDERARVGDVVRLTSSARFSGSCRRVTNAWEAWSVSALKCTA